MVKAVILDLDNTLYAYDPLDREARARVRELACGKLGIEAQRYEEAYLFGREETKRRLGDVGASHNRMLYYQRTLEYLGVHPVPLAMQLYETYWGVFLERMALFDGAREFLDGLREKGIRVMICTDLTAQIQHRKLQALGLAEDVCCLVTSEEAGREKPAPEMFALCLEKLGLPAAEVCCIGDSLEKDVEGARAAGIQAMLFRPEEPAREQYARMAAEILER
ncbi:MAG: HAD family hydrolase [Muribaculaceae bacterium]|nr:HAD family hydrolase [Muribaculaceae bacterium]